jgi:hypothetical protein
MKYASTMCNQGGLGGVLIGTERCIHFHAVYIQLADATCSALIKYQLARLHMYKLVQYIFSNHGADHFHFVWLNNGAINVKEKYIMK